MKRHILNIAHQENVLAACDYISMIEAIQEMRQQRFELEQGAKGTEQAAAEMETSAPGGNAAGAPGAPG